MALALTFPGSRRRGKAAGMALLLAAFIAVTTISCSRNNEAITAGEDYYIRVAQVDKDGATTYSKIVKVLKD